MGSLVLVRRLFGCLDGDVDVPTNSPDRRGNGDLPGAEVRIELVQSAEGSLYLARKVGRKKLPAFRLLGVPGDLLDPLVSADGLLVALPVLKLRMELA